MVYPYTIKKNGVWYYAGTDVPDDDTPKIVEVAKESETVEAEKSASPIVATKTKTEINRMSTAELQDFADSLGIENARETSGAKLKETLIEYFGL